MTQQGATLQNYNSELVACIEEVRQLMECGDVEAALEKDREIAELAADAYLEECYPDSRLIGQGADRVFLMIKNVKSCTLFSDSAPMMRRSFRPSALRSAIGGRWLPVGAI